MDCTTLHYDNARTGWLQRPATADDAPRADRAWGKYRDLCLGAPVRGAPLFLEDWAVGAGPHAGETHTMVYVATSANQVLAFSEEQLRSGGDTPLWHVALEPASGRTGSNIPQPVGMSGTMAIDRERRRLYAVTLTAGLFADDVYRAYALDLDTGQVLANVPITDAGAAGRPTFVGRDHDQRGALALTADRLFVTFAAFLAYDEGPYRGWVVACDLDDLSRQAFFSVTKRVNGGGIWGPGGASVGDGRVFVVTGNSPSAEDHGFWNGLGSKHPGDVGEFFEAVVALDARRLAVDDWYLPTDARPLNSNDLDLGGASALLLPSVRSTSRSLLVTSDKNGTVYLLDRSGMGHWGNELWKGRPFSGEVRCAPAYYRSPSGEDLVFLSAHGVPGLIAFKVVGGSLAEAWRARDRSSGAPIGLGDAAGSPLVVGTATEPPELEYAMVWIVDGGDGIVPLLRAFDVRDGSELFNSGWSPEDQLGDVAHYPPLNCTRRSVFVGTNSGFACYRLPRRAQPADPQSWVWSGDAQDAATIPRLLMAWKGISSDSGIYWVDGVSPWLSQQRVGGVGTSEHPATAFFGGRFFMAWKGVSRDAGIYWSSFDGTSWAPQKNVPGVGTSSGPALADFNGRLFMTWKGVSGDHGIYWSTFDGTSWTPQQTVPGVGTSSGPALTVSAGKLRMAWKGVPGDDGIYTTTFDGTTWAPQQKLPDVGTSDGPALTTLAGGVLMAWKGVPNDQAIYWSTFDGTNWASQQTVPGVGAARGPAMTAFHGQGFMTWRGVLGDEGIYWATFDPSFGWTRQRAVLGAGSETGTAAAATTARCGPGGASPRPRRTRRLLMAWKGIPDDDAIYWLDALSTRIVQATVPSVGTSDRPAATFLDPRFLLTWKGVSDDHGIYWSTFDGTSWASQQKVPGVGTSAGPALTMVGTRALMAWPGVPGDHQIYWATFDGTGWTSQQPVPGVGTSGRPALMPWAGGALMVWQGVPGDHQIYWTTFDGTAWKPQHTVPGVGTDAGAGLAPFGGGALMAWKGVPGDDGIYWTTFDGAGWKPQQSVAGVGTSAQPALAESGGEVVMAWKGVPGDDNIWWSTFSGAWVAQQLVRAVPTEPGHPLDPIGTSAGPALAAA